MTRVMSPRKSKSWPDCVRSVSWVEAMAVRNSRVSESWLAVSVRISVWRSRMSLFMAHPPSTETAATAKMARAAAKCLFLVIIDMGPSPGKCPGEGTRKGRTVSSLG